MTLRLSLVIEGDSESAKEALRGVVSEVERLNRSSGDVAESSERASGGVESLSGAAKSAGQALGKAGQEAAKSVKGIDDAGVAAGNAAGGASRLGKALATIAGSVIGGVIGAGLALAADATAGWVASILGSEQSIRQVLEGHEQLIDRIAKKYKDAARGVYDYGQDGVAVQRFEAQQGPGRLQGQFRGAIDDVVQRQTDEAGIEIGTSVGGVDVSRLDKLKETVQGFADAARTGAPDVIAFREELAKLASGLSEGPEKAAAGKILESLQIPAKLQADIAQARDLVKGLEGDSDAAARALGTLPKAFDDAGNAAARQTESLEAFLSKLRELSGATGSSVTVGNGGATSPELFASGGVVDTPTLFGYGGGRVGLMGEAGPEAIMPLRGGSVGAMGADGRETSLPITRLLDGRLGVKAFASGGVIGATAGELSQLSKDLVHGKGFVDSLTGAFGRLSNRLFDMITNKLFTQLLNGLFGGGGTGGGASGGGLFGSLFGGALPFAKGGVVDRPEYFSTGAGLGVRGEAGPEAVLPLTRGADGSLGVRANGAGGGGGVSITFNVSTPDATSFRRSEAQVTAMLSRAVRRGSGRL